MFQDPKVEQVEKLLKDYLFKLEQVSVFHENDDALLAPSEQKNIKDKNIKNIPLTSNSKAEILVNFLKWWIDSNYQILKLDKTFAIGLINFFKAKNYLSDNQIKSGRKLAARLCLETPSCALEESF